MSSSKYKTIKIFILLDSFHIGGLHKQILNLAKFIDREKFKVVVCAQVSKGKLKREFEKTGCSIYDLKWKRKFDLKISYRLAKILKKEEPEIVFIPQAQALFYYKIARLFWRKQITQIGSFRALNFINGNLNERYEWIDNLFANWLLRSSKVTVVNSKALKTHYKSLERGDKKARIKIIHNGSDFKPKITKSISKLRQEHSLTKKDFIVIMAARLDPWKDFETLFEAAQIVIKRDPNIKFILIGEGILKEKLKTRIQELKIEKNVFLFGEKRDIHNYYNLCDISLLSTFGEGFSNTILESMGMGKTVIATDVGGNREVLGDCGYLLPPNSPKILAELILNLRNNKAHLKNLGKSAKRRVNKNFSIAKCVDSYQSLFSEVIDEAPEHDKNKTL